MNLRIIGILFFFILCKTGFAQKEFSNLRLKKMEVILDWQPLDSLTVLPETVKIFNSKNEQLSSFNFQLFNNKIKFAGVPEKDTLFVRYRVLPFDLASKTYRIDTSILNKKEDGILLTYDPFEKENALPDFGKLNYNGTFSRGVSFGNSQNLVLNSALNLQMAGRLTNDIEILAAVTDNSIPLQPEGNTAQLQEFDRVFIQLKRKKSTLIAGDYELKPANRYFVNYFKKLQGATFSNTTAVAEKSSLKTKASVAIARGKFARNILTVVEGNQGPYRLRGNENERFIIALAGTEKVYLNGEVLQRGLEADYVIDYNSASITFTYRRLVNKDSRIVVEFEYTDQSYLRSLSTVDLDYESKKADFFFTFYNDQDSKNSTADGDLSDIEKAILAQAGDGITGAGSTFSSGIFSEEEFNILRVNYTLTDTVICGQPDSILRYATTDSGEIYTSRFTLVGQGNGDYILDPDQAANGRVYRWVPPIDCLPQGNYQPILILTAPRQQQVFSGGTKIKFSKKTSLRMEGSLSNFDLNRFSGIDDADNQGLAGFAELKHVFHFGRKSSTSEKEEILDLKNAAQKQKQQRLWQKNLSLETRATYEIRDKNFNFLNRYRPQEFTRDWNLAQTLNGQLGDANLEKSAEQWTQANLILKKKDFGSLEYGFGSFVRENNYDGQRHFSKLSLSRNGYEGRIEGSFLNSETALEQTTFLRPKIYFEKQFLKKEISEPPAPPKQENPAESGLDTIQKKVIKKEKTGIWSLGFAAEREDNRRLNILEDSLSPTSYNYDFLKTFVKYEGNPNFSTSVGLSRRLDYLPSGKTFERTTIADDLEWAGNWRQTQKSNLNWSLNYRKLTVENPNQTTQESGETYLGRLGYNWSIWKGAVRSTTNYQIGSGQEPKVEFNYLRVNDGEGVYQWNDYNSDEIPQQNEFETAVFQDSANFVRVSILTDDFIRTNNTRFDQNLQIEPKAIWRKAKGFKKFISRFSEQSTWQIARRVRNVPGVSQWNPFEFAIPDTALTAVNSSMRNTLFFNRGSRKFDLQFGLNQLQNRVVITTGFEARAVDEQFFQGRWNISRKWTFKTKIRQAVQSNDSENFETRNYQIETLEGEPSVIWQPNSDFRTTLKYRRKTAENILAAEPENLRSDDFTLEAVYNFSDKKKKHPTAIRLSTTLAEVAFWGAANSPAGFVMLEGLRDGQNFLWNLSFDRQLFNNMRLSLNYEGRKTGEARTVHLGRAQVSAIF